MDGLNPYFLVAALAGFVATFAHGLLGHKRAMKPMTPDHFLRSRSFGDEDMLRRFMVVTWHMPTAVFFISGVAMLLMAVGEVESPMLAFFVSAAHAGFLLIGLSVVNRRLKKAMKPLPIAFIIMTTTISVTALLGALYLLR